jgi:hypothetical protein
MESKSINESKIKFVETRSGEKGKWTNKQGQTFIKYTIHLDNGEKPEFLAKNQSTIDKLIVGDQVKYSYKKGSDTFATLEKDFDNKNNNYMNNNSVSSNTDEMTQQQSISRSVGWNNVAAIVCSPEFQKHTDLSDVKFGADGSVTGPLFSDKQKFILNQCAGAATIIYKELITKPKS